MKIQNELLVRILVILSICLIIIITIYIAGGYDGFAKFWDEFGVELGSSIISFLFGYLIWGWLSNNERRGDTEKLLSEFHLLKEKMDNIDNSLNIKIQDIQLQNNTLLGLYGVIGRQDKKVRNLIVSMVNSKPFVKDYYRDILKAYHDSFVIESDGFYIKDEYLSLKSYVDFWKYMILKQKEMKKIAEKEGIEYIDNCIIARIVHSNSIHIWTNEHDKYKEYTNQLLKLQKEFIINHGIVIRIFLGPDERPNDDYQKAMKRMVENKIVTRYVKQTEFNKLSYDFLLLHDEQLVYMWQSDSAGKSLAGTIIKENIDKGIYENWENLYDELSYTEPIKDIPSHRKFNIDRIV